MNRVLVLLTLCITIVSSIINMEYEKSHCNYTTVSINYTCVDDSSCPTWFDCNTESNRCECGEDHHGMIRCDEAIGRAFVSNCHCVTYDSETKETQVGSCYYNCENTTHKTLYDRVYHPLPENPTELNTLTCGRFNRTGTLCGQCLSGHSPLVLSYNLSCIECPDGHRNWWKFVLAGFAPLTLFYFFIVVFNINVTSSRLRGVVLFSQAVSMPALARILLLTCVTRPDLLQAVKVAYPLYSFWNLDFFRTLIPDICMNVSTLQALALDYAIAVYPIFLITLSYVLIALYDRDLGCTVAERGHEYSKLVVFQTCCFPKCTFTKAIVSRIELFQSYKFPKLQFSQLRHDAPYGRNCAPSPPPHTHSLLDLAIKAL